MSEKEKDLELEETEAEEKEETMDFSNFLTAEDEFRLEMEDYMPEFMVRMKMDTLNDDPEFIERTLELQKLSEKAGIDMSEKRTRFFLVVVLMKLDLLFLIINKMKKLLL